MVRKTQVAQLQREANKMGEKVRRMNATIDEDGAVDVRMREC